MRSTDRQRANLSFSQSLLAALPFTKTNQEVHKALENANSQSFFDDESKRVFELKELVKKGHHDVALERLLAETDVDNPLQYFNKIRHNETPKKDNVERKIGLPVHSKAQIEEGQNEKNCSWRGFNGKHSQLHCVNVTINHPWKTYTNIWGEKDIMKTDFCAFHQKYCIDPDQRHKEKIVQIKIANKDALCAECFIMHHGAPPRPVARVPGLRRCQHVVNMETYVSNKISDKFINIMLSVKEEFTFCRKWRDYVKLNFKLPKAQVNKDRTTKAVLLIQHFLRRNSLLQKDNKLKEEDAAFCITSFFRRFSERRRVQKKILLSTSIETFVYGNKDSIIDVIKEEAKNPVYDQDRICSRLLDHDDLDLEKKITDKNDESTKSLFIEINAMKRKNRQNNPDAPPFQTLPSFLRHGGPTTRCLEGRRIRYMRCFSVNDNMMDTSRIVANERPFLQLDPMKIGIVRRREFSSTLKQLWEESGHPLPVVEEKGIMKAFDCRDGFVDYKKYLRFATQQFQPCLLHGRFVCTSASCTYIINGENTVCPRIVNSSSKSKICMVCGDYIFSHTLLPKVRGYEKKKRGLNVFSEDDLTAKFANPKRPDLEVETLGKASNFSPSMPVVPIPNDAGKSKGRCKEMGNKSESIKDESCLAHQKRAKDGVFLNGNISFRNQQKSECMVSKTSTTVTQKCYEAPRFNPKELSDMLEKCLSYKNAPNRSKTIVNCPLCSKSFFDPRMSKKHLLKRHTRHEIEFFLSKLTNKEDANNLKLRVLWTGNYVTSPPMPPPVPLKICFKHVPPHPKCKLCQEIAGDCPLYPPIKFYTTAFVSTEIQDEEISQEFRQSNFHFNLNDKEQGVIIKCHSSEMTWKRFARLKAMCQDGFQRYLLGVSFYFSHKENISCLGKEVTLGHTWDEENELIVESDVHWIDMSRIVGRCRVYSCNREKFYEQKSHMGFDLDEESPQIKFCEYLWNGRHIVKDTLD